MSEIKLNDIYGTTVNVDLSRSDYIRLDFKQSGAIKEMPQEFVFSMTDSQATILKEALQVKLDEKLER